MIINEITLTSGLAIKDADSDGFRIDAGEDGALWISWEDFSEMRRALAPRTPDWARRAV